MQMAKRNRLLRLRVDIGTVAPGAYAGDLDTIALRRVMETLPKARHRSISASELIFQWYLCARLFGNRSGIFSPM